MIKQIAQNLVLPFALFSGALFLAACSDSPHNSSQAITQPEQAEDLSSALSNEQVQDRSETFKSGNMFYIVRDVADLQLKAGEHLTQLQNTKTALEDAVREKDSVHLQTAVEQLDQQLQQFNATLDQLNLKSQEIHNIRQELINTNQRLLDSPWMNGEVKLKDVDFAALEKQMGNIQGEMLKLAAMLIPQSEEKQ